MIFSHLTDTILDLLFPIACLYCGAPHLPLCPACVDRIPANTRDFCFVCRKPAMLGITHPPCRNLTPIFGTCVATPWPNPPIREAIYRLKYDGILSLAEPFRVLLEKKIKRHPLLTQFLTSPETRLLPVPLHRKKFHIRGFNQSELIARGIARYREQSLPEVIARRFNMSPQANLRSRVARLSRARGSFALTHDAHRLLSGRNVIIIDDVLTTGATIAETARLASEAGAQRILAFTLAHG